MVPRSRQPHRPVTKRLISKIKVQEGKITGKTKYKKEGNKFTENKCKFFKACTSLSVYSLNSRPAEPDGAEDKGVGGRLRAGQGSPCPPFPPTAEHRPGDARGRELPTPGRARRRTRENPERCSVKRSGDPPRRALGVALGRRPGGGGRPGREPPARHPAGTWTPDLKPAWDEGLGHGDRAGLLSSHTPTAATEGPAARWHPLPGPGPHGAPRGGQEGICCQHRRHLPAPGAQAQGKRLTSIPAHPHGTTPHGTPGSLAPPLARPPQCWGALEGRALWLCPALLAWDPSSCWASPPAGTKGAARGPQAPLGGGAGNPQPRRKGGSGSRRRGAGGVRWDRVGASADAA